MTELQAAIGTAQLDRLVNHYEMYQGLIVVRSIEEVGRDYLKAIAHLLQGSDRSSRG